MEEIISGLNKENERLSKELNSEKAIWKATEHQMYLENRRLTNELQLIREMKERELEQPVMVGTRVRKSNRKRKYYNDKIKR